MEPSRRGSLGLLEDRQIGLHFVCDEETGSVAGSGYLRQADLIDPEALVMLTAEPTGAATRTRAAARSPSASRRPAAKRTSATSTRASTHSST